MIDTEMMDSSSKKELCQIFKEHELRIKIENNIKITNVLDTTLNLHNGEHSPYNKPNNIQMYVNIRSIHPPSVLKNISEGLNRQLRNISANSTVCKKAIPTYQGALDQSGHKHQLGFSATNSATTKKSQPLNVVWYNPHFSRHVATNIRKAFLKLLNIDFTKEHKLFNKNNVKLSNGCVRDMNRRTQYSIPSYKRTITPVNISPATVENQRYVLLVAHV